MMARLETMALMSDVDLPVGHVREQIGSTTDLIVHMARLPDRRRVVARISSVDANPGGRPEVRDLFAFQRDRRFRAVVAAPPGSEGLQPFFAARLSCLIGRVDGLWIVSGYRTRAEQAALYERKPELAAPPGRSNHELGLAADLGYPTDGSHDAAHAEAAGCGLQFPVPYEPTSSPRVCPEPFDSSPSRVPGFR